jgi:hypothetical protein
VVGVGLAKTPRMLPLKIKKLARRARKRKFLRAMGGRSRYQLSEEGPTNSSHQDGDRLTVKELATREREGEGRKEDGARVF